MLRKSRLVLFVTIGVLFLTPMQLVGQGCNTCSSTCQGSDMRHFDFCNTAFTGWSGGDCLENFCWPTSCSAAHGPDNCFSGFALTPNEIGSVLAAAESNDVGVLRAFLVTSAQVSLHSGRRALQIVGCGGDVVASITLAPEAFRRLGTMANVAATMGVRSPIRAPMEALYAFRR